MNTQLLHRSQRARRAPLGRPRQERQSRAVLAPIYGRFTEGFGTLNSKKAKIFLDALAP